MSHKRRKQLLTYVEESSIVFLGALGVSGKFMTILKSQCQRHYFSITAYHQGSPMTSTLAYQLDCHVFETSTWRIFFFSKNSLGFPVQPRLKWLSGNVQWNKHSWRDADIIIHPVWLVYNNMGASTIYPVLHKVWKRVISFSNYSAHLLCIWSVIHLSSTSHCWERMYSK